jgi:hypothetical protein
MGEGEDESRERGLCGWNGGTALAMTKRPLVAIYTDADFFGKDSTRVGGYGLYFYYFRGNSCSAPKVEVICHEALRLALYDLPGGCRKA